MPSAVPGWHMAGTWSYSDDSQPGLRCETPLRRQDGRFCASCVQTHVLWRVGGPQPARAENQHPAPLLGTCSRRTHFRLGDSTTALGPGVGSVPTAWRKGTARQALAPGTGAAGVHFKDIMSRGGQWPATRSPVLSSPPVKSRQLPSISRATGKTREWGTNTQGLSFARGHSPDPCVPEAEIRQRGAGGQSVSVWCPSTVRRPGPSLPQPQLSAGHDPGLGVFATLSATSSSQISTADHTPETVPAGRSAPRQAGKTR